jgi:hypothetical protein
MRLLTRSLRPSGPTHGRPPCSSLPSPETWYSWYQTSLVSELARIVIFKIVVLLIGLGSSMIYTHKLIILTNTKELTRYCGSNAFDGKIALNTFLSF